MPWKPFCSGPLRRGDDARGDAEVRCVEGQEALDVGEHEEVSFRGTRDGLFTGDSEDGFSGHDATHGMADEDGPHGRVDGRGRGGI